VISNNEPEEAQNNAELIRYQRDLEFETHYNELLLLFEQALASLENEEDDYNLLNEVEDFLKK
jgi:hypothetical protein